MNSVELRPGPHRHECPAGVVHSAEVLNPVLLHCLSEALLLAEAQPNTVRGATVAEGRVELNVIADWAPFTTQRVSVDLARRTVHAHPPIVEEY